MCQQYDIIPIICTSGVDNSGNLLLVSTTPAKPVANFPPVSLTPVANLPLVSPPPRCMYPPRNFLEKFEMILMLFSGAWGRWFMKKTWSKKSRDTVPLIHLTMIQLKVMLCVQWANAEWGSVYFELKQNDDALCTLSSWVSWWCWINGLWVKLCVDCVNAVCCSLNVHCVNAEWWSVHISTVNQWETRQTMITCNYVSKFLKNNIKFGKFSQLFHAKTALQNVIFSTGFPLLISNSSITTIL